MSNSFVITNNKTRHALVFRLMEEKKQTLSQFFIQWGGVLCHDLIDYTPPRPKKGVKANWPQQKKAGEGALERDIRKVFKGPDELISVLTQHSWVANNGKLLNRLIDLVRRGDYTNLRRVLDKIGMRIRLIPEPLREQHFSQRNYQGRVRRPSQRYYLLSDSPIKGYVSMIKPDVGKLKSAWLTAAKQAGLNVRDVPAWVSRHSEPGQGRANLRGPRYELVLVNRAKAAGDKDPNKIVAPAQRILEKKMQKSLLAITGKWHRKYGYLGK